MECQQKIIIIEVNGLVYFFYEEEKEEKWKEKGELN